MNVTTFNQHIVEMLGSLPEPIERLNRVLPKWETAPLFDYATTYDREHEIIEANKAIDVFAVTPFPVFRFNVVAHDNRHPEWGKYRAKAVIGKGESLGAIVRVDSLMETAETYGIPKTSEAASSGLPFYILLSNLKYEGPTDKGGTYSYDHAFGMAGRWFDPNRDPIYSQLSMTYVDGFMKSLGTFLVDAMSPNTHIASVHPAREHKSVEWIKARTHYTLITHGHPANRREVREGERVASDEAGELHRMAHNRRAHYREYRHERYRFARGERRLVRQAWIGPAEWKDEGGKQIYRVLNPINDMTWGGQVPMKPV